MFRCLAICFITIYSQREFWPLMLEAQVKREQWTPARRLAGATLREIEAGNLFASLKEMRDEAKVRRLYVSVLDHAGERQEARRQLEIAEELMTGTGAGKEQRIARMKSELLASEAKEPGTPFRLTNLDGKRVGLSDYRGKAVVVAFWATWCEPCLKELEELNRLSDRYRDDSRAGLLTVNIDDSVNAVATFAKKAGYRFPSLKSDGTVEGVYTRAATLESANIPQLYVFDPEGNIRFHITGHDDDGLLASKLEWMIQAAWK